MLAYMLSIGQGYVLCRVELSSSGQITPGDGGGRYMCASFWRFQVHMFFRISNMRSLAHGGEEHRR